MKGESTSKGRHLSVSILRPLTYLIVTTLFFHSVHTVGVTQYEVLVIE